MGFDLPWFPIYAAEMLADGRFQGWNLEERGAWITLLAYAWNDGDLPAAHSDLARLLHVDSGDMARIWSAIGSRFAEVPSKPGRVWCLRLEEERDKARQLSIKRQRAGEAGAHARWSQRQPDGNRMPLPLRSDSDGSADAVRNQCPLPSPSPPPSPSPLACMSTSKLGPFGSELVRRVEEGLGHGLVPARNGVAESLEADIAAWGGVDAALAFIASTCRNRNTEPQSVAWLAKVLGKEGER